MQIYYDSDADQNIVKDMNIVIVGYGSQGHAHANNLKDSGVDVTVGLREGSSSWGKASEAGLNVKTVEESISNADLIMILAPDEFQKGIFEKNIRPNLKPDAILAFAHGFNIHFKKIIAEETNSVI
ncbi:MAG: ketol-acid reductoisomerase, partial [Gammaproteobacteria bacterium]|nr:ketol-acid reductoisomerase [Gammaproteobacteria bacterium]